MKKSLNHYRFRDFKILDLTRDLFEGDQIHWTIGDLLLK